MEILISDEKNWERQKREQIHIRCSKAINVFSNTKDKSKIFKYLIPSLINDFTIKYFPCNLCSRCWQASLLSISVLALWSREMQGIRNTQRLVLFLSKILVRNVFNKASFVALNCLFANCTFDPTNLARELYSGANGVLVLCYSAVPLRVN